MNKLFNHEAISFHALGTAIKNLNLLIMGQTKRLTYAEKAFGQYVNCR